MQYAMTLPNGGPWADARILGDLAALAEAGATWWVEYVPPETGDLPAARAAIGRGPLRV